MITAQQQVRRQSTARRDEEKKQRAKRLADYDSALVDMWAAHWSHVQLGNLPGDSMSGVGSVLSREPHLAGEVCGSRPEAAAPVHQRQHHEAVPTKPGHLRRGGRELGKDGWHGREEAEARRRRAVRSGRVAQGVPHRSEVASTTSTRAMSRSRCCSLRLASSERKLQTAQCGVRGEPRGQSARSMHRKSSLRTRLPAAQRCAAAVPGCGSQTLSCCPLATPVATDSSGAAAATGAWP